jgi:hypothetical protein
MADHWVRLGMAITIIGLISIGLYQLGGRASAVQSVSPTLTYTR